MCGGVQYGDGITTYFPNPYAKLPLLLRDGSVIDLPWGRRREQEGRLPQGGWARLDSLQAGRWNRYNARNVKIMVDAFMEKDHSGRSQWFEVTKGQCIHGIVAQNGMEQRVYVVTITPEDPEAIHHRWPRIVPMNPGSTVKAR